MTDQPAPYSQEAEEAVLGAVIVNPNAFLTIASFLNKDDFFFVRHNFIWEAFARLYDRKEGVDYVTLAKELQDMGRLELIGGPAYLTQLINAAPSSQNAEIYGRLVERASIRRKLIATADEIKDLARNEEMNIETVTSEVENRLFSVTDRQVKREFIPMSEAVSEYFDRIEYLMTHTDESLGVPSGFRDLDALLGGFQRSDLLIFAARPGMGKCVSGDTLIPTEFGLKPIADLKPEGIEGIVDDEDGIFYPLEISVQTPDGNRKTSHFYDSGIKPTLKITTRAGFSLTGTYNHPLLLLSPDGEKIWKPLSEIKRRDFIAVVQQDSYQQNAVQPHKSYTVNELVLEYVPTLDNTPIISWDEITHIEDGGLQHCYDLTVPDSHSFVANGIVSHNTSFLITTAMNAARFGGRVAIFTMEMGVDQFVQRMISMETGISAQQLRAGKLSQREYSRFVEAAGRVSNFPIFIDDTPALSPIQMRTKCRRLMHEHGIDLILVDYMQLMNSGGFYQNNRVQEVSFISRSLKELARELNVPMISAAQLSRAVEQRQDKRPVLSDLRESGSLEQDSDIVMFLYRDAVYNEASEFPNQADIIIAKHRNGPTGTISLYFDRTITKFMDGVTRKVDLGDY